MKCSEIESVALFGLFRGIDFVGDPYLLCNKLSSMGVGEGALHLLGPFLYILDGNYLMKTESRANMFADYIYWDPIQEKTEFELSRIVDWSLHSISSWFYRNGVTLNIENIFLLRTTVQWLTKCCCLVLEMSSFTTMSDSWGLRVNENLNWKKYIENVILKVDKYDYTS